jgi:hypothetical protein
MALAREDGRPGQSSASPETTALQGYAGIYERAPDASISISVADGTLFSQTGDQDPIELSANSGDVFVIPDGDARITFTRDASGAIAGLILHQDGRDWIASKS